MSPRLAFWAMILMVVACSNPADAVQEQVEVAEATAVPPTNTPPPSDTPQPTDTPMPTPIPNQYRGTIKINGNTILINCEGEGSPAVILDSGLGEAYSAWFRVQSPIAETTRVCSYTRARGDGTRTSQDVVDDLHELLQTAVIPPPYILVGHSFGGYNVRLFADQYPDEVAGMVLVDVSHEEQRSRIYAVMTPQEQTERDSQPFTNSEGIDWDASAEQVAATGSLGDIPLIVLTRGVWRNHSSYLSDETRQKIEVMWREFHEEMAALSSNGRLIVAAESDHHIQNDQPEVVIEAILDVVKQVR